MNYTSKMITMNIYDHDEIKTHDNPESEIKFEDNPRVVKWIEDYLKRLDKNEYLCVL